MPLVIVTLSISFIGKFVSVIGCGRNFVIFLSELTKLSMTKLIMTKGLLFHLKFMRYGR